MEHANYWLETHGTVHYNGWNLSKRVPRFTSKTRRCGSVYLGVVVLAVWYFTHALLQLNNCHHILPEKINPLLHLFAEPHSLYSWTMFENMHIFNADMLGTKLQHRTWVVTAWRVRFISAPLILTLWGRLTDRCGFTPITLCSVFRLLTRANKVP